jgi:hypothetical protein
VQTFDEANPAAGWSTAPALNYGRAHHNTVQLPDRSMVTVGGGYGILNGNRRSGDPAIHRNIELYDPATGQWALGPAQDELRTYHSTALLLPDGRVMSAGDDGYGGSTNDTAEIYEPPYLFKGTRPTIDSAPGAVTYGEQFTVQASGGATQAVLMAPAAVTHANDMSQRLVPLDVTVGAAGALTVRAPAAPELAPPTYYMLFVLNAQGVPSVAKFVRLKLGREYVPPPSPPPAPPAPETTPPPSTTPPAQPPTTPAEPPTTPEAVDQTPESPASAPAHLQSFLEAPTSALTPVDSVAPALEVVRQRWERRRVVVEAACPTEACTATAAGRLLVPGAAKAIAIGPTSARIGAGARGRLAMRLSTHGWRRARRALRARRAVWIRVELTARDAAGNATTARRRLKRARL